VPIVTLDQHNVLTLPPKAGRRTSYHDAVIRGLVLRVAASGSRTWSAGADLEQEVAASPAAAALRKCWADLLRRVYEIDPLVCPRCSATMRVVGFITRRETIDRILDHQRRPPTSRPRSPPAPAASIPEPLS